MRRVLVAGAISVISVWFGGFAHAAKYAGRIELINGEGGSNGYVRNWDSTIDPINGVNALGPSTELHVEIDTCGSKPVNVVATNANFPAPFYVGGRGTVYYSALAIGSYHTVSFVNVNSTHRNSTPDPSTYEESAIWTLNESTKQLTPQWINPDGSLAPTVIAYDIVNNDIFFVGDVSAYNAIVPYYPVSPVSFYLVAV